MPKILNTAEANLRTFIREWLSLLEKDDYAQAAAQLWQRDQEWVWSASNLKKVIQNYGGLEPLPGISPCRVTPLEEAEGQGRFDVNFGTVIKDEPWIFADIWLDLPLNGRISEVTSTFYVHRVPKGAVVELHDIRVM